MHGVNLEGEDKKKLDFLNKALSNSKYPANKATYLSWVKFFEEGEGGAASSRWWLF